MGFVFAAVEHRVWWTTNPPGSMFFADAPTRREAEAILTVLSAFDAYLVDKGLLAGWPTAGGIQYRILGNDEWIDDEEE